jgi:hypothetical protein
MTTSTTIICRLVVVLLLLCHPAFSWLAPSYSNTKNSVDYPCRSRQIASNVFLSAIPGADSTIDTDDEDDTEDWIYEDSELLDEDDDDDDDDDKEEDWIPDNVLGQGRKKSKHLTPAKEVIKPTIPEDDVKSAKGSKTETKKGPTPYTEEEEELIAAMGGRSKLRSRREDGFLGDSTLADIATDYSVPIVYLADVIAMWGVPVPINIHERLGDLVTGEQAFALVEAVNSLDVGALQDRYSNSNILQLCADWNMDIKNVFEFAMKEGWNLPFGVRTNLRVEQEAELLRVFSQLYAGE